MREREPGDLIEGGGGMRRKFWSGRAVLVLGGLLGISSGVCLGQGRVTPRQIAPRREAPPRVHDQITLGQFSVLYRPSVVLRHGNGRGSGTVIASVAGDTLILTAAHVVSGGDEVSVELHPYNLGLPISLSRKPEWPKVVPGRVIARETAADVALVRVEGMKAMPYLANLAGQEERPEAGQTLTALGYDGAKALIGWRTRVEANAMVDLGLGGGSRPYVVTERPSVEGRSGGALFREDGTVVGVCTGRFEIERGRWVGLFASLDSIHAILKAAGQEERMAKKLTVGGAKQVLRSLQREP